MAVSDFKTPMSVGQISPATAGMIIEDVVATVLDITVAAWPHVCQSRQVVPTTKEDDITDRLRWEMEAEKKRRDPPPQLRFERETNATTREKKYPTGLIDVYVIYSFDETDYFAIECKKVTDRHERRANYYVQEGVCRFSSGKYSPGHPYGAMIAFVTKGTAEAAARLRGWEGRRFRQERNKIQNDVGLASRSNDLARIPNLYSTKHGQAGTRNTILLLHLFLPFPVQKYGAGIPRQRVNQRRSRPPDPGRWSREPMRCEVDDHRL